jgi:hypothetical protein
MTENDRPTREVHIYHGSDIAVINELRDEFNRVARQANPLAALRLGDESPVVVAGKAYDDAVREAMPRATSVTLRALRRKAFRDLLIANPPRDGNADDEVLQYNQDGMHEALVEYFNVETGERTIIDPEFGTKQALTEWVENLNYGMFTQLAAAAIELNEIGSPNPKAPVSSQVARLSDEPSPSPDSTD